MPMVLDVHDAHIEDVHMLLRSSHAYPSPAVQHARIVQLHLQQTTLVAWWARLCI
jgi:hypothetical protein